MWVGLGIDQPGVIATQSVPVVVPVVVVVGCRVLWLMVGRS